MSAQEVIIFREVQHFRQRWLWAILTIIAGQMWVGAFRQFILKVPFGSKPAPDLILLAFWMVFGIIFPIAFYKLKLVTEVRVDGLYMVFSPFKQVSFKFFFSRD